MARVLLIHNPEAGYQQPSVADLLEALKGAGHTATYQSSKFHELGRALDEPADLIVIAGGDGTVTKALKFCAGRPTPVAFLPLGTANNVALSLGHGGDPAGLIGRWDLSSHRPFRLGLVRGPWGVSCFCESFGVGALARTIQRADRDDKPARYDHAAERLRAMVKSVRHTLRKITPQRITIDTANETITGRFLWAEVSRVGLVGPNIPLAGGSDPWGAALELAMLPANGRAQFLRYLDEVGDDPQLCPPGLITRRARRLKVRWHHDHPAQIDGRILPRTGEDPRHMNEADLSVDHAPVRILVLRPPPGATAQRPSAPRPRRRPPADSSRAPGKARRGR